MNDTPNTPQNSPAPAPGQARTPRIRPQTLEGVAFPKTIKSFVRRAGRVTTGQTKAFAELGTTYLLPYQAKAIDFVATYADAARARGLNSLKNDLQADSQTNAQANAHGSSQVSTEVCAQDISHDSAQDTSRRSPQVSPTILEIGFGMGEATAHIAALLPDTNFLCCEVHEPGVGALLKRIGEQHLHNIRICAHDAVEVIDHMLPEHSLDGIHIFFPDPWHKKKHNKRRLIQAPLIAKLAARLKVGGYIHCATDWQPYAEQILDVLSAEPLLKNTALTAHPELLGYAPKPHYRPLTKFENRGIKLGHGVWDVVFERRA